MGRDACSGYLLLLGKSFASLSKGWMESTCPGDQWCYVAAHGLHTCCTMTGRVVMVTSLTVLGEGGELKSGCLSSQ